MTRSKLVPIPTTIRTEPDGNVVIIQGGEELARWNLDGTKKINEAKVRVFTELNDEERAAQKKEGFIMALGGNRFGGVVYVHALQVKPL
jgi:hypothetical protein